MMMIDGAHGEGGGQLVRMACALAAITGTPVRLANVRARRDPSGLAPQHLAAVRAVTELCGAETDGLALRATEFVLRPDRLRSGEFRFDVGTAGSITLVLQALLPVALAAPAAVQLRVRGGTDVRAAPPLDYLQHVLLPLLARLGVRATLEVVQRGYYPRGGGEAVLTVEPARLTGITLDAPGMLEELGGALHIANLPTHILERMENTARQRLARFGPVSLNVDLLGPDRAVGSGGAVVLWARTAQTLLGGAEVAQRGVPAEAIATCAARSLTMELDAGVTLDVHASDQLLVYLALARGASSFTVREVTSHSRTTAWLIEQFLPVHITFNATGKVYRVAIRPRRS
ncbi:MAG TPA: RNA 3'-terminal phosphate cyclase [Gammaproteobacteria bacterium]|nr:RNA 3'-terminal phosphate cyclase [Gammaproteobacteria bacterium]